MYFTQLFVQLFIFYGFIASVGFGGASSVAASVAVTQWFLQRRGLAFGILGTGFGVGQLLLVPSALGFIQEQGWRMTMLFLGGGLCLAVFPLLFLLLRSAPTARSAQSSYEEINSPLKTVSTPSTIPVNRYCLIKV